jgi:hypothetical protein
MWMKHPKIAHAWAHGKSSVTGKKEGKAKNKGLPYHSKKRSGAIKQLKKKGLQKNYR